MLCGGINKLDAWKEGKDSVQKRHEENAVSRTDDKKLDSRLRNAFENFKTATTKTKESPSGKETPKNGEALQTREAKKETAPLRTDHKPQTAPQTSANPVKTTAVSSGSVPPSSIYKAPAVPVSDGLAKGPQVREASNFIPPHAEKAPQLSHLLKSVPPTPPKIEDQKQPAAKNGGENVRQVLGANTAKIQAAIAANAGGELSGAAKKKEEGKTNERKEGKKTEGSESSKGKSALAASGANRSEGEGKLEAASSGIAGGGEPEWLGDLEPGIEVFNPGTSLDENLAVVLRERTLLRRYVYKNFDDPAKIREAEAILDKALAMEVNPELTEILNQGKAARKNVYGGTSA